MQATPVSWHMLIDAGWAGKPGFKIVCGGEALPRELAEKLTQRGVLWNAYGPTETTIWSSLIKMDAPVDRVTIGKPLANTTMYVLDQNRQPVPAGVPGELYIGGDGLSPGYWKRDELTGRSSSPILSAPGKLVSQRGSGPLSCGWESRISAAHRCAGEDRGFRIELAEIENALREHPGARIAAVKVIEGGPLDKGLAAYFVGAGNPGPEESNSPRFSGTEASGLYGAFPVPGARGSAADAQREDRSQRPARRLRPCALPFRTRKRSA